MDLPETRRKNMTLNLIGRFNSDLLIVTSSHEQRCL